MKYFIVCLLAVMCSVQSASAGTLTVYPDPGNPGTVTADAAVSRNAVNETFPTIRAGNGTTVSGAGNTNSCYALFSTATTDQFSAMTRQILTFDTSPLAGQQILGAVFSVVSALNGVSNNLGTPATVDLTASSPTSNNFILAGDYQTVSFTSFASIAVTSINVDGVTYNDLPLNASGINNINVTGISRFATMSSWDLNNSFTGVWVTSTNNQWSCDSADQAGTSKDPKLVITYQSHAQIFFEAGKTLLQSGKFILP